MNRRSVHLRVLALAVAVGLAMIGRDVAAQRGRTPKTDSRILYHDGRVMAATSNLYIIWYGCWTCSLPGSSEETQSLVQEFATSFGGSAYAAINTTYPDVSGLAPSGGLIYGGAAHDLYSHGSTLTESAVAEIVAGQLNSPNLPLDTRGIYIVLPSSDVHVEGLTEGRCQFHRTAVINGSNIVIAAIANAERAPTICAPQFVASDGSLLPTPNDNLAYDATASWMAHVINGALTNPHGGGWYDRYGLESSDKCQGTFGETFTTPNGAQANVALRWHNVLIQQNWVNVGRGYCGLHLP